MESGGLTGNIYKPLSADQVVTIHERALDLLEESGMTYEDGLDDVLVVLSKAGCKIDKERRRIFFPRLLVQVAGLVARRIICRLQEGEEVKRGSRFGLIYFGSRVDLYLPPAAEPLVKPGSRVRAGQSVLALLAK